MKYLYGFLTVHFFVSVCKRLWKFFVCSESSHSQSLQVWMSAYLKNGIGVDFMSEYMPFLRFGSNCKTRVLKWIEGEIYIGIPKNFWLFCSIFTAYLLSCLVCQSHICYSFFMILHIRIRGDPDGQHCQKFQIDQLQQHRGIGIVQNNGYWDQSLQRAYYVYAEVWKELHEQAA